MKLELHRFEMDETIPQGRENRRTRGRLYVDGRFQCVILEDEVRETKIKERTAIPAGIYRVRLTWSPKYGRIMPLLEGVPGFDGIRIHSGHDERDTWGCLLTGQTFDKAGDIAGGTSRPAYAALFDLLSKADKRGEAITITITNDFMED